MRYAAKGFVSTENRALCSIADLPSAERRANAPDATTLFVGSLQYRCRSASRRVGLVHPFLVTYRFFLH